MTLSVQVCESLGQKIKIPEVLITKKAKTSNSLNNEKETLMKLCYFAF